MAISPQRLTIYLYSAHRAVIFAIAQISCITELSYILRHACSLISSAVKFGTGTDVINRAKLFCCLVVDL